MRIIGDVHGNYDEYLAIVKDCQESIQVGDMGFDYNPIRHIAEHHKFIGGNHDNYDEICTSPNNLGNFGIYKGIGFIRGAKTIDRYHRILGITRWDEEELNYIQGIECVEFFEKHKPETIVSHDCPQFVTALMGKNIEFSTTRKLLNEIYELVKPKHWLYGHHHKNFQIKHENTIFQCVGILQYVDI